MMQSIYTISFFCLLRFDEVLNIQHHISILNLFSSLPSRKRHSRYVYHWSKPESGYSFRKIRLNYQVSEADKPLVSFSKSPETFQSTDYNPAEQRCVSGGTYSSRRGGCHDVPIKRRGLAYRKTL
ncbi:hypothetical protein V8E54_004503 [Elaphomyces granulatus]